MLAGRAAADDDYVIASPAQARYPLPVRCTRGTNQKKGLTETILSFLGYLSPVDRAGRTLPDDESPSSVTAVRLSSRVYISEIRQILGDEPNEPRYIEMVTARGYRFLPPVASGFFSQSGEEGPKEDDPALKKEGSAAELGIAGPGPSLRRSVTFQAPEGPVRIDPANQHTWKTVRVGKIIEGGQFEVIWSSEKPIRPETFPRSRTPGEWRAFLEELFKRWRGHWTEPYR